MCVCVCVCVCVCEGRGGDLGTYSSAIFGRVCQSASSEIIKFDVPVIQGNSEYAPVIMRHS